jgi:type I restriction enzyme, R subunit
MDGKAMIGMSRRICANLYNALVKIRPHWQDADDAKGALKVVMTGSASDVADWQQHIRNKPRLEEMRKRFKNAADSLRS